MIANVKLEQFEGPFDLLLSLIGEQKLSISEVSLSEITEQYLQYLDKIEKNRAEEMADFLVVATRLLLLKSKLLLPQFTLEEELGPSLEEQLRLYKAFVEASREINKLWLSDNMSVFRVEPPRKMEYFVPPNNLILDGLHQNMVQLVSRLKPPKPLPETRIDKAVSMKDKVDFIRKLLRKSKRISFNEILNSASNRTELIIGFLALLELVKQRAVALQQTKVFEDIVIERV